MGNLSFAQPPAPTSGTLGPPSAHIDEGVRASWGYPKCVSVMLISLASRVAIDVAPAGPRVDLDRWALVASTERPMAEVSPRDEGVARGSSARVRAGFNSPDRDNAVVVDADKVSPMSPPHEHRDQRRPPLLGGVAQVPSNRLSSRRLARASQQHRLFGNLQRHAHLRRRPQPSHRSGRRRHHQHPHVRVERRRAGFVDWQSVRRSILHLPSFLVARLPALPFTLASPALGLLLVFRTNASYARWVDSRVAWGRVVSHCRNIMRQSSTWMREDVNPAERRRLLHGIRGAYWAFPRCLASHVSGPDDERRLRDELTLRVGERGANRLLRAPNRPLQALADLSRAVHQLPMDEKRRVEVDKSVILLGDALETCERIFTSPVPLVYTRHTARFLSCWLCSSRWRFGSPSRTPGTTRR